MSFVGFVGRTTKSVYNQLPQIAGAAGISAGVSYVIGRLTSRVTLSAPLVAAKLTAATGLLFVLNKIFQNGLKPANADLSTLSLTLPGLYGINTFINSGKSILSVSTLKLSAHVLGSLMVTEKISMPIIKKFKYTMNQAYAESIDAAAYDSLKELYSDLPRTVLSTATVGLLCHSLRILDIDPRTAMIVTVAAAALRLVRCFLTSYTHVYKLNYLSDLASTAVLTYVAKELFKLNLPAYKILGKTYVIAMPIIYCTDRVLQRFNPSSR